jgi:hypothetical protein
MTDSAEIATKRRFSNNKVTENDVQDASYS